MLLAESRNQRFSNFGLPSIRRARRWEGVRSVASVAGGSRDRMGKTIYHFVRNMIVQIRDKLARFGRGGVARSRFVRRETIGEYGLTDEAAFKSDVSSRATTNAVPHDPLHRFFFFCAFAARPVCIPYRRRVYVHTLGRESHGDLLALSPSFLFPFFFFPSAASHFDAHAKSAGTRIARTFFLDGVGVGYLVDVPCVPRPVAPRCCTIPVRRHCCQSPSTLRCGHCCHCRQLRRSVRKCIGGLFSAFSRLLFISLRITLPLKYNNA